MLVTPMSLVVSESTIAWGGFAAIAMMLYSGPKFLDSQLSYDQAH